MAWLRRSAFAPPPSPVVAVGLPIASVMLASLAPVLPLVATAPVMPPFGYLMLIAWRLLRPGVFPVWIGIPLGLFDDLLSGNPLGTALALWTASLVALDVIEMRLPFNDLWQSWLLAAGFTILYLLAAELLTRFTGPTPSPAYLLPQVFASAILFPAVMQLCLRLDRWRLGR